MKTTILYIAGWGSTPSSDTTRTLSKAFKGSTFISPLVHHDSDPDLIQKQMDSLGHKLQMEHDAIVVGSSAGGFWADYIGAMYGIKAVLINPSLKPSVNFKKFNLSKEYYDKYKIIEEKTKQHGRHHMVAFAGEKDDVVPIHHVTSRYKTPIVLKGEGHRLSDLNPVIKMINSLVGNFPEHH